MTTEHKLLIWGVVLVVVALVIYALSSVLFPFLAGIAIAYLLDPLADRLERVGVGRGWAAALILGAFAAFIILVLLLLAPILYEQMVGLVGRIPEYINHLAVFLKTKVTELEATLTPEQIEKIREAAGNQAGDMINWLTDTLGQLWGSGVALLNALSLLVITPVVAFYLLRDWDRLVAKVNSLLPEDAADTIRARMKEIDERLSGFVRGQGSVCLVLAAWNGIGLSLVGLNFGLVVGIASGLLSFIPYFGTAVGFIAGIGLALAQFDSWLPMLMVVAVCTTGQLLEGFILTPKLVGDQVNLHPVWVLFALMAGGGLLGFTGVLIAVPAAAVIGVLVRYIIDEYVSSPLYYSVPREPKHDRPDTQ